MLILHNRSHSKPLKMLDRYSKEWLCFHRTFSRISMEHLLQEFGYQFLQSSLAAMEESWLKHWSRPTTPLQIAYEFSKFNNTELLRRVHDSFYIRREDIYCVWGILCSCETSVNHRLHSAAMMVEGAWLFIKSPMIILPCVEEYCSTFSILLLQRQDYWTSCSCIGGNVHEFQKPSKIPSISASDGAHVDIRHLATSDLPSLSIITHRESLASHVKHGHDWSLMWGWNFPTPDVITLPSSFEEDGHGVQLRNCRQAVTAKKGVEKRKTPASVGNELVRFSSQPPPWQTGRISLCWSPTTLSPPALQELMNRPNPFDGASAIT